MHAWTTTIGTAVCAALIALTAWSASADTSPSTKRPDTPAPPSTEAPNKPDPYPGTRDPGMVKQPDVQDAPGAVVTPPVVDPKMAVNPEQPQAKESAPAPPAPSSPESSPR